MAFKTTKSSTVSVESPEALLRDLRSKKIKGPLSHQADLWRAYEKEALHLPDVALQSPTGSGKTLVGLILGEWRRVKFNERVVYLCPTNQLVHQVVEQATQQYGLKVNAFVGKKSEYSANIKGEYLGAEALAITSYSSLFNVNPFFNNAAVIILDDAHAAENYISKYWSLRISRTDHKALYTAVIGVFLDAFGPSTGYRLSSAEKRGDKNWVEKVPTPLLAARQSELINVLDGQLSANDTPSQPKVDDEVETKKDLSYRWSVLRDHLQACHIYFDTREVLIRPLIPPTFSHHPFADAKQRIYMSATLGEGGELERLSGRPNIKRLAIPGWEKQGIGRRFFVFPERSLSEAQTETLMQRLMRRAGRSLVLVPDDETAKAYRQWVKDKLGFPSFDAKAIENSKEPFLKEKNAVAVVANRYDGIDFPDDQCRFLVVAGLPKAINLHEKFLINRLGSGAVLNDRILTRMVQAFGRCTRSSTDFAAVILEGDEVLTYLLPPDRRRFFHPELQGELEFGISNSKGQNADGFFENIDAFLEQSEPWKDVESEIVEIRDRSKREVTPGAADLNAVAADEIKYQAEMWQADYAAAFDTCRTILGKLTDPKLRGYRAAWGYLAGSAASLAGLEEKAREQFAAAQKAAVGLPWLVELAKIGAVEEVAPEQRILGQQIETLETNLVELGTLNDRKFAKEEQFILENIEKSEKQFFEPAHVHLGTLIGFQAGKEESRGSPDPWWVLHEGVCLVFEDHAGATTGNLDVSKARQAATHPNWIRQKLPLRPDCKIIPVLVTPVTTAEREGLVHLGDVYVWPLDEFRSWARNAVTSVRTIRRTFQSPGDLVWRAEAATALMSAKLDAKSILDIVLSRQAATYFTPV